MKRKAGHGLVGAGAPPPMGDRGPRRRGGPLPVLADHVNGYAPPVVRYAAGAVGQQLDLDLRAEAGVDLVEGAGHQLVDELVQPSLARVADVHAGARPDVIEVLVDLDVLD